MGILQGRKGLILGVANEKSIAWGVARTCHREGAELGFNYLGEALKKRVYPLAESIQSSFIEPLDVANDAQLDDFFAKVEALWGRLDFLVHSIAFANRESMKGNFRETTRADFHLALDISAYSFIACARRASRLMGPGGSMVTMSYLVWRRPPSKRRPVTWPTISGRKGSASTPSRPGRSVRWPPPA
jgi:enoyl-[acyl-carrier protein] reductase I